MMREREREKGTPRAAHTISDRCGAVKNYNGAKDRAEKPLLLDWQTADPRQRPFSQPNTRERAPR